MGGRSLRGIEETLSTMRRVDNSWSVVYVRDVGYLLRWLTNARNETVAAKRDLAEKVLAAIKVST